MPHLRFSLLVAAASLVLLGACDRNNPVEPAARTGAPRRAIIAGPATLPVSNDVQLPGMMLWNDVQIPVRAGDRIVVRVTGPIHLQKNPAYPALCQAADFPCDYTAYPGGDVGPGGWDGYYLKVSARLRVGTTQYVVPLTVVSGDSMSVSGSILVPADGVLELWRQHMGSGLTVARSDLGVYGEENEYTFSSSQQVVVSTGPTLNCTPAAVTRGQTVQCSISDLTGVSVQSWEFVGEMFVNDPTLRITESIPSGTWQGTAVEGGTVKAHIYFNGVSQTLSSAFSVANRTTSWQWGPANWAYNQGGAPLCHNTRPAPNTAVNIGWNRNAGVALNKCSDPAYNRWVLPDPTMNPSAGYTVASVASGPNRGRWYVTSASYRIDRASNLNPHWLPNGTLFALKGAQATECANAGVPSPVSVNLYIFNETCKGIDVDDLIAGAWGHEGFGHAGGTGHQGVAQAAAANPDNDPVRTTEPLTAATATALHNLANTLVDGVSQRISAATADGAGTAVTGNWPGGQIWLWDPGLRLYVPTTLPNF